MKVFSKIFLVVVLSFSLSGCDWWDDMADSISGSDDDKPAPVAEPAVAETAVAETAVVQTATTTPQVAETKEVVVEQQTSVYETKFHHTQTDGPDEGKSLVMCPGQERMNFDKCVSDGVTIPRHTDGDGRETYWNMSKEPKGDIICTKGGKEYRYPASNPDSRGFVWGKC